MARENSILLEAYNRLLTFYSIALLIIKKALDSVWHVGCYEVIWDRPRTDHIDKSNLQ